MLTSRCAVVALTLLASLLCAPKGSPAQDPGQAAKGPPPIKLQPEKGQDLGPGAVAVAHGTGSTEPARFWLDGLSVAQPVAVAVATDPNIPLTVTLHKDKWDESLKEAMTGGPKGTARFQLSTQGELGIKILSPNGTAAPFTLMVWVGDEVPPQPVEILVPVADYANASVEKYKAGSEPAGASSPTAETSVPAPSPGATPSGTPQWLLWTGVGGGALSLLVLGLLLGRVMGRKGGS